MQRKTLLLAISARRVNTSRCPSEQVFGIVILLLVFLPRTCLSSEHSSTLDVPWEPEDLPVAEAASWTEPLQKPALLKPLAQSAIQFYRRRIAIESTDRCPFHISCSRFAEKAVQRFGFVRGIALFIDRHFFREHVGARQYYSLREALVNNRITLKLDDSFYLADKRGEIAE